VASRRAAEHLIGEGRVAIEGDVVTDPARDVGEGERVEVDGRALAAPPERIVCALNKPLGVISTARDTHGRPTVVSLVRARGLRLYPVGRLDADSSGLILLTNDGELANRLTHPRFEVQRTYRARVAHGPVGERALRALRRGVELDDGLTAPASVRRVAAGGPPAARTPPRAKDRARGAGRARSEAVLELTIREGRNRQVRRMCEAVGHPVLELERIAFGPLRLGDLAPGEHRILRASEVDRLRAAVVEPDDAGV